MTVKIVVIVDNYVYREGLESDWGLSIYIESSEARILFDLGSDPGVFARNIDRLGIDLSTIDYLVISHSHGDHTGGIDVFTERNKKAKIYIPPDRRLKNYFARLGYDVYEVEDTINIADDFYVFSNSTFLGFRENSLILKHPNGLVIFCGCSHPGIANIVGRAVKEFNMKPYIVMGGMHSPPVNDIEYIVGLGAKKIAPMHCSGDFIREYLKSKYPDIYMESGVGHIIEI